MQRPIKARWESAVETFQAVTEQESLFDTLLLCDTKNAKIERRFQVLLDTVEYDRPLDKGNRALRLGGAWMPVCDRQHRRNGRAWILSKKLSEFLREETGGGMEVDQHW